ncbi:hypothetical protein [Gimesia chilikensis]|uniref:Guanylate cyclase domain-containing protein n=1 Tax=Gimesia chilikensis TaxID=2605989 RepID=A0A517PYI2_9PLAN|nr:hypothetical protein [Gimesia chilikensis]QDT24433.1 hypothetical protein HG66A1_62650 [Gimesia chilikensis]
MDIFQLQNGRYLLYLDVLGFKQVVQNRPAHEAYEIINKALAEFHQRGMYIREFKTLYFSDTIIFYQDPVGWGRWAFSDIYAIAGLVWTALAANGIPCRGAISFGEFFVELDSNKQHSIFFGKALIDAYETESNKINREWMGITLCPSACQAVDYAESGVIDVLTSERRFFQVDEGLRLNPFMKLPSSYFDYQIGEITDDDLSTWDAPDFPNDVKALEFILSKKEHYQQSSDSNKQITSKYVTTSQMFTDMLGPECVEWARNIAKII